MSSLTSASINKESPFLDSEQNFSKSFQSEENKTGKLNLEQQKVVKESFNKWITETRHTGVKGVAQAGIGIGGLCATGAYTIAFLATDCLSPIPIVVGGIASAVLVHLGKSNFAEYLNSRVGLAMLINKTQDINSVYLPACGAAVQELYLSMVGKD